MLSSMLGLHMEDGVICTPGDAFGSMGEGYVRFALVLPVETLREIIDVIDKSGIPCECRDSGVLCRKKHTEIVL